MTDIKRLTLNIAIFLPFAIIIYFAMVIIAAHFPESFMKQNLKYIPGPMGDMFYRTNEARITKDVDILFLGSSHAYRGFDTRIFKIKGYKTFNLGSSSQTPLQTNVLLNRYLEQLNPKLVIFEVSPLIMNSDGIESTLDLIKNDKNDIYTFTNLIDFSNASTFNTAIYGFYMDLFKNYKPITDSIRLSNDLYISGGFVQRDMSYYKAEIIDKQAININPIQIDMLDKIIERLKKKDIKLILLQTPITKSLYNSYTDIYKFDSIMNSKAEYYNFNKIVDLNDSIHFYDSDHMNQNGVEVFDKEIMKLLMVNGLN
ncbi:MAG: hypothetical protein B6I18_04625 [Bacteroidetes bacterium 4572_112]|nr:MAG: hypothetical protein B6I18_04625 [Bacteroidetes bacterium 4572_112]